MCPASSQYIVPYTPRSYCAIHPGIACPKMLCCFHSLLDSSRVTPVSPDLWVWVHGVCVCGYVVCDFSAENKRRSKHAGKSLNPEWNQTVIYKNIHLEQVLDGPHVHQGSLEGVRLWLELNPVFVVSQLRKKTLEVSVWDYDKSSSNDFLGEVILSCERCKNIPPKKIMFFVFSLYSI